MLTGILAAAVALLVATTPPLFAFAEDKKTADKCEKYLDKMRNDLDTLEALVPNAPPEEESYLGSAPS